MFLLSLFLLLPYFRLLVISFSQFVLDAIAIHWDKGSNTLIEH